MQSRCDFQHTVTILVFYDDNKESSVIIVSWSFFPSLGQGYQQERDRSLIEMVSHWTPTSAFKKFCWDIFYFASMLLPSLLNVSRVDGGIFGDSEVLVVLLGTENIR